MAKIELEPSLPTVLWSSLKVGDYFKDTDDRLYLVIVIEGHGKLSVDLSSGEACHAFVPNDVVYLIPKDSVLKMRVE